MKETHMWLLKQKHMKCNIHAGVHICSPLCLSSAPFQTSVRVFTVYAHAKRVMNSLRNVCVCVYVPAHAMWSCF